MAESMDPPKRTTERLTRWLLKIRTVEAAGPEAREDRPEQHSWWQVVCLTGVDYAADTDSGIVALRESIRGPGHSSPALFSSLSYIHPTS